MHALYPISTLLLGLAVVLPLAGLLALLCAACGKPRGFRAAASAASLRLVVLVPAHDEELVLAQTLDSLLAQNYPQDLYEVVVIADNCADSTAPIARSRNVTVWERVNPDERGKGYALDYALCRLLDRPDPADAFVVVDADTFVAPNFLSLMAARLAADNNPQVLCALQGRYGVLNDTEGWRAALMAGAFDLVNHVKPLGRERLGLSVGLKGNGMAFSRAVCQKARWHGDSLTEDLDFGLDLARLFHLRVGYVSDARVWAQMPTEANQAASQRARWERGRTKLRRERALPLLWEGLTRRNLMLFDAGWDLIQPPLAELGALLTLWAVAVGLGMGWHLLPHPAVWLAAVALSFSSLLVYILGGLRLSGAPRAAYAALVRAPFYAVWKFCLLAARLGRKKPAQTGPATDEWIRTARAPLSSVETPRK